MYTRAQSKEQVITHMHAQGWLVCVQVSWKHSLELGAY